MIVPSLSRIIWHDCTIIITYNMTWLYHRYQWKNINTIQGHCVHWPGWDYHIYPMEINVKIDQNWRKEANLGLSDLEKWPFNRAIQLKTASGSKLISTILGNPYHTEAVHQWYFERWCSCIDQRYPLLLQRLPLLLQRLPLMMQRLRFVFT